MSQLDLFSLPAKKEPAENQQVSKNDADIVPEEQVALVELTSSVLLPEQLKQKDTIPSPKDEVQPQPALPKENEVIFSDRNIGVKFKLKKQPEPVIIEEIAPIKPLKILQKRGRKSLKDIDGDLEPLEIPNDEELFKKQYYPISVVAQWFKVNTSLLRFWENEFDILKPRKNRKGDRLFRPEDIKNLELIHHLLRHRKYSIEGAKEFLKGNKEKADAQLRITKSLLKFKSFLLELKANLG